MLKIYVQAIFCYLGFLHINKSHSTLDNEIDKTLVIYREPIIAAKIYNIQWTNTGVGSILEATTRFYK
jgi:hypothetical protein